MRRSIGVAGATTTTDQLQLLEVLGEGAFGKVYKGGRRGPVCIRLFDVVCWILLKGMCFGARSMAREPWPTRRTQRSATWRVPIRPSGSTDARCTSGIARKRCARPAPLVPLPQVCGGARLWP
jgi:hypothetical protein